MTTRLMGVSIPRSGHHFLVDLLRALLRDDFRHCEFYAADDCCRRVPCTRHFDARIFYQKHHDLDLQLPTDLAGVRYVVQVRDPVMSTLSDREHIALREGEARATDRDEYLVWLGQKACYYERFFEKWVLPGDGERMVVEYDDLVAQTAHVLRRITTACGVDVDDDRIMDAVAAVAGVRALDRPGPVEPFTRRTLPTSRFLDPALLPAFESLLLDRIAGLRSKRRLDAVDYADHPLTAIYRAERARAAGDLAEALHQLDRAVRVEPRNRHLLRLRATILAAMDRIADAIASATAASELAPDDGLCLRLLSDLRFARSTDDARRARALAERLVTLHPGDAGHRIHLATILLRLGDHAAARDHARRAVDAQPRDPYVWRYGSEILATCQDRAGAIDAVRGAIALAPEVGEFHHHLANLLASEGRIDAAAASHARAIALEPDQRGWHWKYGEDLRRAGDVEAAREVVQAALARFPGDPQLAAQRDGL